MPEWIRRYAPNTAGRDFAVGDVHGHFSRLRETLERVRFDPACDRLFSVGDLVDRGPECEQADQWLAYPWFHAVRGNHEDFAIRHAQAGSVDTDNYLLNGGGWFLALPARRQAALAAAFARLPLAIEVETDGGIVGVVHADCPVQDWAFLSAALCRRSMRDFCMWSRRRLEYGDQSGVDGVRAVVVGHTPIAQPLALGNVHHIDTGGWLPQGRFTLLDLRSLAYVRSAGGIS